MSTLSSGSTKSIYIPLLLVFAIGLSNSINAQELVIDLKEINTLLENWTEAQNTKNLHKLGGFYADDLIFYTQSLLKENCIEIKSRQFQSDKHFHQEIINKPTVTVYSSNIIKVTFIKRIESGSTTTDYDAYLLLKKFNPTLLTSKLLIVGESDLVTDRNAQFTPKLGTELKRSLLSQATPNSEATTTNKTTISGFSNYFIVVLAALILVLIIGYIVYKRAQGKPSQTKIDPRDPR